MPLRLISACEQAEHWDHSTADGKIDLEVLRLVVSYQQDETNTSLIFVATALEP